MRPSLPVVLLMLGACSSPSPTLWGAETTKVSVDGYDFKVHHSSDQAEAFRTNPSLRLKAGPVFQAAAKAMAQASGCKVDKSSLTGDVAMVSGDLIC